MYPSNRGRCPITQGVLRRIKNRSARRAVLQSNRGDGAEKLYSVRCSEQTMQRNLHRIQRGQTCKEKKLPYSSEVVPAKERCGSSNGEPGCGFRLLQKERRLLYDLRPQQDNIDPQGGKVRIRAKEKASLCRQRTKAERKTARIAQWWRLRM